MKKKTITLYNLDELSKKAQERAHKDWIEGNDYTFLSDCMNERLHELLDENHITDLNDTSKPGTKPTPVLYSLGNSQGDGAMFEGEFEWKSYRVSINHTGRYSHSYSKTIDIYRKDDNELITDTMSDDKSEEVYEEFETLYQSICKSLEEYGYNWIEEEDSFERFEEACTDNEYTFLEDGKMTN